MFEPKVIDFLRRSELVQALPKQKLATSGRSEGVITEDLACEAMTPNSMLQPAPSSLTPQGSKRHTSNHTPITKFLPTHKRPSDDYMI